MVFIGFGLGIALGGAIGSEFGWRAAFLSLAALGIVVALADQASLGQHLQIVR